MNRRAVHAPWRGRVVSRRSPAWRRLSLVASTSVLAQLAVVVHAHADVVGPLLAVSAKPDRSGARALEGATVVADVAIFAQLPTGVVYQRIDFYLDDLTRSGAAYSSDSAHPFDFNGTAPCSGASCATAPAVLFDTVPLREGSHRVTAVGHLADGLTASTTATFVVEHPASEPVRIYPDAVAGGVRTDVADAAKFLYSGEYPPQEGVGPDVIDAARAAVIRGRVTARDGAPLTHVKVVVADRPEYGSTRTRADGWFDLVVNGGEVLTVALTLPGHIPAHREVHPGRQAWAVADDTVLVPYDAATTTIDLDAIPPGELTFARGSTVVDDDGTRTSTLLIPHGVTAQLVMPDGSRQPAETLTVRQTEFTVGATGEDAMPAPLPPTSAFTYAVDLSVDEARAAGATGVEFSKPLWHYVDNFLQFPAGTDVPAGRYDGERLAWVPSDSGVVLDIVGEAGGLALVDLTDDGVAEDAPGYAAIGLTDAERTKLAALYDPGASLWRVPVAHFSPWDLNWGFGLSWDAIFPIARGLRRLVEGLLPNCGAVGSVIGCEEQSLGEHLAVPGTGLELVYDSRRTPGSLASTSLDLVVAPASTPATLKRIDVEVQVAGLRHRATVPVAPNARFQWKWDGRDAYGRRVNGAQVTTVTAGYVYDGVYTRTARFASLGDATALTGDRTRRELTLSQTFTTRLTPSVVADARGAGLGGWTLDVHHGYDPLSRTVSFGDGSIQQVGAYGDVVSTVAGTGRSGFAGDGSAATAARLSFPGGVAVAPDGSIYVADTFNDRVRKISPTGDITTIAGTGDRGFSGDGGPAVAAQLSSPLELALARDGSLFVADVDNHRVRRIARDGTISTVAGTGVRGFSGDGGLATQARLAEPVGVALAADGTLFVADFANHRVRAVAPDGTISTVAGTGVRGYAGDGNAATAARLDEPSSVALDPGGSLYVADAGNHRVRRITPDGRIGTVAGTGVSGDSGDGGAATAARLSQPCGVVIDARGTVYVAEQGGHRVRRVFPDGTIDTAAGGSTATGGDGELALNARLARPRSLAVAPDGAVVVADAGNHRIRRIAVVRLAGAGGKTLVPSRDGSTAFEFDAQGRHLRTIDAVTGTDAHVFRYDTVGRLASVTDRDGNAVTITRPSAARVVVTSPDGHATELTLDSNGWFSSARAPSGRTVSATHDPTGMLTSFADGTEKASGYGYDTTGRLIAATGRDGKTTTLERDPLNDGHEVTVTTPMGRQTVYRVTEDASGTVRRVITDSTGLDQRDERRTDGSSTVSIDGVTLTTSVVPDPRWGMAAPHVRSATVTLPGKAPVTTTSARTITLAATTDPLSLTALNETHTVGGKTWTTTYSATTDTITETTPEGRRDVVTLDDDGRVVQTRTGDLDAVGYVYDARGRIDTVTRGTGTGARQTAVRYKPNGFVDTVTDPAARVTAFGQDEDGRVVETAGPAGTSLTSYDGNGAPKTVTPPGRPAYTVGSAVDGRTSSYAIPAVGGPAPEWTYGLNDDRQYSSVALPDGTSIAFAHDTAGRLSGIARGGKTTTYDFAADGRFASSTTADGLKFGVTYTGVVPTATTWTGPVSGSVATAFDDRLRLSAETVGGTPAVGFTYGDDGLLAAAGPLTLGYTAAEGLLASAKTSGTTTTFTRNGLGEPTGLTTNAGATVLHAVTITARDKLARIDERAETIAGATTTSSYGYHPAGQLASVVQSGATVAAFGYDLAGNVTTATRDGVTVSGTYDDQDRLTSWGGRTFTHTASGERRTTTDAATGDVTTYHWDLGRLMRADLPGGMTVEYLLDGAGRRIGKRVDGVVQRGYLWSNGRVVAELDGAGTVLARFVYATRSHVPDIVVKGTTSYRVVTDERGSVRLVVNAATGTVAQRIDYDVTGRITADTSPGFQPFGYAGGLTDQDTDVVLFGARTYDPETIRWLSRDTAGFAGGRNHYTYADGDPVNRIDPSGLAGIGCFQDIIGLAGMIPVVGTVFDIANAGIYVARGQWGDGYLALGGILLPFSANQLRGAARFADDAAAKRGADFVVDSRGTTIPTDPGRLRAGLENPAAFHDVSINPAASRKFVGVDDGDPLRIRVEKGHFDDPSYTGPSDPLHTIDHLHVERRANGATGPWTEAWKIPYPWPF